MTLTPALDGLSLAHGAAGRMSTRLTEPFAPGGDVQHLALAAVGGSPEAADVPLYNFREHSARYDRVPTPSYVVRTLRDLDAETRVQVHVTDPALGPGGADTTLVLPAGTLAGESRPLRLPAGATDAARLTRFTVTRLLGPVFVPTTGDAAAEWAVSALLGNTARLLWVLGGERDALRRQIARTATQRPLATATGDSLDLLGVDLAVPRFPPLPHSVDDGTVGLWHLDDVAGAPLGAEDFTARFPGRSPHHGVLSGAVTLEVVGRFGPAMAFAAGGAVTVAAHSDLNLPAVASFTAECFVKPEATTPDGRVLARRGPSGTGWSIEIGEFGRGLPRTARAVVSDGTTELVLFGDHTLTTDRFTHLALVLDRVQGGVGLWIDGLRVAQQDTTGLGAITVATALVLGGGPVRASLDEVRFSRVARAEFAPVLGEGDEHYRRRLRLFRRWVLPTPAGLTQVLNDAVGSIGGVSEPLLVDDGDAPITTGSTLVRVVPKMLRPGEGIDAAGTRDVTEEQTFGGDPDDTDIPPTLLLTHTNPTIDYGPASGTPSGNPHLMQPPLARSLDRLVQLLTAEASTGRLRVIQGWTPLDPSSPIGPDTPDPPGVSGQSRFSRETRAAGRGVVLTHPTVNSARLAALAHRAGCAFVTPVRSGRAVYAACGPGNPVLLDQSVVEVGASVPVSVTPVPPAGAEVQWTTALGGPGQVEVTAGANPGAATVKGLRTGFAVIGVDITHHGFTATASGAVRVVPLPIPTGSALGADGTPNPPVPESAAPFDPNLLITVTDPRATFSGGADKLQRGFAKLLDALLDDLATIGPGVLSVGPGAEPLAAQGREVVVKHPTLSGGALGVRAHVAGFTRVAVSGGTVRLQHDATDLIEVDGPHLVEEGATITLNVAPDPASVSPTTRLSWSDGTVGPTAGEAEPFTDSPTSVALTGQRAGWVWVQAVFREAGADGPYAMHVRLAPAVPAGATITRDQYDLIMNVVHALHPLGVEVLTRAIRPAVVELAGTSSLAPEYTYPKFRLHRAAPRLRKESDDG